jgi:hypothetical protein
MSSSKSAAKPGKKGKKRKTRRDRAGRPGDRAITLDAGAPVFAHEVPTNDVTEQRPGTLPPCARRLEEARAQWQLGDWTALATLADQDIENCAERARLALLAAAGLAQLGQMQAARRWTQAALGWGCDRELVARVLVGGALNSLATAALVRGDSGSAETYFASAVETVTPHADVALLGRSRMIHQMARLGRLPEATALLEQGLGQMPAPPAPDQMATLMSNMHAIRAELTAARGRDRKITHLRLPRSVVDPPFVIAIAGVPRSGSTWLFNAVRHLCEAAGETCYAAWVDDYAPADAPPRAIDIVKLHNPDTLTMPVNRILTTRRDLIERLASILRMGWISPEPDALRNAALGQARMAEYWAAQTDCEITYQDIETNPAEAVARVARATDLPCDPSTAVEIADALREMSEQETVVTNHRNHDPETLMHPGHRASEETRQHYLALVREALARAGDGSQNR